MVLPLAGSGGAAEVKEKPVLDEKLVKEARSCLSPLNLASSSPNRLELLEKDCGIKVSAWPQNAEETRDGHTQPSSIVSHIALIKIVSFMNSRDFDPLTLSLALDTMVSLNDEILGKPKDRNDARRMLGEFSGRMQEVVTGWALFTPARGILSGCSTSRVFFSRLSDAQIESYLDSGEWAGAAGGYRIQKTGYTLIERIEGSWSNVIGLPLEDITKALRNAPCPC